jgi:ribosome-binding protein aMBF1 (putative translation factor)
MRALMRAAMESQLEDLRQQLAEYEALRAGRVQVLELDSLGRLPEALIRARIAAGLTQKELARRLGLREQQVQRYEATRYAGASLARLQAVADALGVQTQGRVVLRTASGR